MIKPFSELRVVELATVLAGPAVGQFWAELGAEVWKIEPPSGDVTRGWRTAHEDPSSDPSSYFACANAGKRSVVLDLRQKQAREQLFRFLAGADLLLTNYRPGADHRLGLNPEELAQRFPHLIQGAITGYGPASDRAGYDAVIQAESGFMFLNREPEQPPAKMPVALIDLLAAHQLKQGLLWALYQRAIDGRGRRVEVSLLEAAAASLANQATAWLLTGHEPQPLGSEHPNLYPYGALFEVQGGESILLAVGSDRQFADLAELLGHRGWSSDPRFATNTARVRHRAQLREELAAALRTWGAAELLQGCRSRAIPAGQVLRVGQALSLPEVAGLVEDGWMRTAVFLSSGERLRLAPAPRLNQHADEWSTNTV